MALAHNTLGRRAIALAGVGLIATVGLGLAPALADMSKDEKLVTAAVESFRKGMLTADKAILEPLCAENLSYGHSAGKVENKEQFLTASASGKSNWQFINQTDQTVQITGADAVVRFLLTGETVSEGKTNAIKIGVLMVWQQQGNQWKLLARQSVKV